jgi:SSS family solute:Na+ symporter
VGSALPKWFGILFLLTLLSAAMSTLSSQFHTIGSAIGRDVFVELTGRTQNSVLITRMGVGLGLVMAIVLGTMVGDNIIAIATAIFFGLCAAAFLPAFVGGLFSRRMSRSAAIWSIVAGFTANTFWMLFVNAKTAAGVGICMALTGKPILLPTTWSATWAAVDPLFIGLPISATVLLVILAFGKPMDPEYANYVFGGPAPKQQS